MFNFFKKTKEDLQELFKPIEVTELKSAWQTSDGMLFQTKEKAVEWQQQQASRDKARVYRNFLKPHFQGDHFITKDFGQTIHLFELWELYIEEKLKRANKNGS
jgi:hypothetical protein